MDSLGLRERRELVMTASRGCPFDCTFCAIPRMDGNEDRRRPIGPMLDFISDAVPRYGFDYVTFAAPTFTARPGWVRQFCKEVLARNMEFRWRCVTAIRALPRDLVGSMAESGCIRIAFGVETLEKQLYPVLGERKFTTEDAVLERLSWCRDAGIKVLCYLMIGVPGQTKEGVRYTLATLKAAGASARVTAYSPYDSVDKAEDTLQALMMQDRNTVSWSNVSDMTPKEFVEMTVGTADY